MITIDIVKRHDGRRSYTISGHSGYSESGSDIICAAVSVLGQTAIEAILQLTDIKPEYEIDEENAFLDFKITLPEEKDSDRVKAEAILDAFEIGCRATAESYGKKYIKINNTSN